MGTPSGEHVTRFEGYWKNKLPRKQPWRIDSKAAIGIHKCLSGSRTAVAEPCCRRGLPRFIAISSRPPAHRRFHASLFSLSHTRAVRSTETCSRCFLGSGCRPAQTRCAAPGARVGGAYPLFCFSVLHRLAADEDAQGLQRRVADHEVGELARFEGADLLRAPDLARRTDRGGKDRLLGGDAESDRVPEIRKQV